MILGKWSGWWLPAWLGIVGTLMASSPESTPTTRDTLVYKDGDRVQGRVIERTKETIVFKSDRFGELRVPAGEVVVIPAEAAAVAARPPAPPPAPVAAPKPAAAPAVAPAASKPAPAGAVAAKPAPPPPPKSEAEAANRREEERLSVWDRFTPAVMTARVRKFFGPWNGRLSFSTEIVSDVADRENSSWEVRIARKWKKDDLQLNGRFDYAETNKLRTTDMIKGTGAYRHEFNKTIFAHYRPTVEWNRATRRLGVPNEYVLLQQEVGTGYHLYTSPTRAVRLGVSQNRFDVWNEAPVDDHTSRRVGSAFEEIELKLPWKMGISQRGVWYPVRSERDGWENRIDLNKKLTETLSTSVRHEIRRHNPDGSAQDYERLKLLFALDF